MTSLPSLYSAFRHGRSYETAKLRVFNYVLCSADGGDLVLLVLFDLIAAFDTVDHSPDATV